MCVHVCDVHENMCACDVCAEPECGPETLAVGAQSPPVPSVKASVVGTALTACPPSPSMDPESLLALGRGPWCCPRRVRCPPLKGWPSCTDGHFQSSADLHECQRSRDLFVSRKLQRM